MPVDTDTAQVVSLGFLRAFDRFTDSVELMIPCQHLHRLAIFLAEDDEVLYEIQKTLFVEYTPEKNRVI